MVVLKMVVQMVIVYSNKQDMGQVYLGTYAQSGTIPGKLLLYKMELAIA